MNGSPWGCSPRSLDNEAQRHVRERMSEEELVVFDILTRPAPELSTEECAEVKKVARDLLARLQGLLVLDWRKKAGARAQLQLAIEDTLDAGLPRAYSPELYRQKCSAVFEHVYESYAGWGRNLTALGAPAVGAGKETQCLRSAGSWAS